MEALEEDCGGDDRRRGEVDVVCRGDEGGIEEIEGFLCRALVISAYSRVLIEWFDLRSNR